MSVVLTAVFAIGAGLSIVNLGFQVMHVRHTKAARKKLSIADEILIVWFCIALLNQIVYVHTLFMHYCGVEPLTCFNGIITAHLSANIRI